MNTNMGGYDFRSSSIHYKPPNPHDNMGNMGQGYMQPHQMYYDMQTAQPAMDQGQYMSMMPVQNIDQNYEMPRYYWREMEPKHPDTYPMGTPSHSAGHYVLQSPPPPNIVQRIAGIIKSQLPGLQAIMVQVSSIYNQPRAPVESRRQHSRSRSRSK